MPKPMPNKGVQLSKHSKAIQTSDALIARLEREY
jgi:hypothetical protein